ncbi:MAG: hypothetical protein IKY12_05920, partial [Clostridia bacterium]|nr:hypothetical protein [Clostridia bacterium]
MKKIISLLILALIFTFAVSAESGDFNDDGKENLLDAISVFKQIPLDVPSKYADIDGDGEVSVSDGLVLINRIVNEPIANELANASNTFDFTATGAAWSYNNGQLVVNSVSNGGDGFAISNVYIPGGTSFEFEATMQITEGTTGGIAFGVAAPIAPSAAWYCVNIDGNKTRLFSVGTGTVGTASSAQRPLTDGEKAKDTYTIRIEVSEKGKISFWLDGGFVASYNEPNFAGGYIGFNAFKSRCVFTDMKLRVGENGFDKNNIFDIVSGNWSFSGGNLTATNSARGDSFAMIDIYVPAKTAFRVDATLNVTGGNNTGGIVFGVNDKAKPGSGWYCINVAVAE